MKYLFVIILMLVSAIIGFWIAGLAEFRRLLPIDDILKEHEAQIRYEKQQKELQTELLNVCEKNLERERNSIGK